MKTTLFFCCALLLSACQQEGRTPEKKEDDVRHIGMSPDSVPKAEDTTQPFEVFPNVHDVIPPGYQIVNTKKGEEVVYSDLNKDGHMDAAVLIEMQGDSTYEYSEEVLLMIFINDQEDQLEIQTSSGNLGGESTSYRDTKKLSVNDRGVIVYYHQSMRHNISLKFRYEAKHDDYMLIGKDMENYGSMSDGPSSVSINYLTGKKIEKTAHIDEEKEEVVPNPDQTTSFNKPLQPVSAIDFDSMYDDL